MIVPLISDDVWQSVLGTLPAWTPPNIRTLVVAPHPDDESLGAGGLIRTLRDRGTEVLAVAVTDGENAYSEDGSIGPTRRREQEKALQILGVPGSNLIRLSLPDRNVASREQCLIDSLLPLAKAPCHILAPWTGDFHPDHEACGRAASEVAKRTGALLSFYFFWTWHRGTLETIQHLPLKRVPLNDQSIHAKTKAVQEHHSQLHHLPEPILNEELLRPTLWPFEVFADA